VRKLKKVGTALHISPIAPNILIAKTYEYLDPGVVIYNSDLKVIGVVIETFGPVKSPYARIKLDNVKQPVTSGEKLFILLGERKRVTWRKMPRRKRRKEMAHS